MTTYESVLADVQAELVAVSLEYSGESVTDIFVFVSTENGTLFWDPFFAVEGEMFQRHKLPSADTSIPQQRAMIKYGMEQLDRLITAAKEFGQTVPARMKLHYIVATNSLDALFEYNPVFTDSGAVDERDLSDAWRASIDLGS